MGLFLSVRAAFLLLDLNIMVDSYSTSENTGTIAATGITPHAPTM